MELAHTITVVPCANGVATKQMKRLLLFREGKKVAKLYSKMKMLSSNFSGRFRKFPGSTFGFRNAMVKQSFSLNMCQLGYLV